MPLELCSYGAQHMPCHLRHTVEDYPGIRRSIQTQLSVCSLRLVCADSSFLFISCTALMSLCVMAEDVVCRRDRAWWIFMPLRVGNGLSHFGHLCLKFIAITSFSCVSEAWTFFWIGIAFVFTNETDIAAYETFSSKSPAYSKLETWNWNMAVNPQ